MIAPDLCVPILMPLWDRLVRLPQIIRDLNAQTDQNFELVVWLNGSTPDRYERTQSLLLADLHAIWTLYPYEGNIGGFGRFMAFRQRFLGTGKSVPPFAVCLDDDISLRENFIAWARTRGDRGAMWGRHGFRFNDPTGSYWNRTGVDDHLDSPDAHMVATQATVLDTAVLQGTEIADVDPDLVFGMEDIWLAYVATVFYGYRIRGCRAPVHVLEDGKDTWPKIREKKNQLLTELRGRGWKV